MKMVREGEGGSGNSAALQRRDRLTATGNMQQDLLGFPGQCSKRYWIARNYRQSRTFGKLNSVCPCVELVYTHMLSKHLCVHMLLLKRRRRKKLSVLLS